MGLRHHILNVFDRPGGRGLLGGIITLSARVASRRGVAAYHKGAWVMRVPAADRPDAAYFYADHRPRWPPHFFSRIHDTRDTWFHAYKPQPGDVVVDVGAGAGWDVVGFAHSVGPSGHVYAIEAHPRTFACLQVTCRENRLENVSTHQLAIADAPGKVYIEDRDHHIHNSIMDEDGTAAGPAADRIPVPSLTLDAFCVRESIDRIDFLKMNIEGAEQAAIRGMNAAISIARHVCIACHDFRGLRTHDAVRDVLSAAGFEIIERPEDHRPWIRDHLHARRH